jgi:hypothetical protein
MTEANQKERAEMKAYQAPMDVGLEMTEAC